MQLCIKCGHPIAKHNPLTKACFDCSCSGTGSSLLSIDPTGIKYDGGFKPTSFGGIPITPKHPTTNLLKKFMDEQLAKNKLQVDEETSGLLEWVKKQQYVKPNTPEQQAKLDKLHDELFGAGTDTPPSLPLNFLCPPKPRREPKQPNSCARSCRGVRWMGVHDDGTLESCVWCPECGHGTEPPDELVRLKCMLAAELLYGATKRALEHAKAWVCP